MPSESGAVNSRLTKERLERYLAVTKKALAKLRMTAPPRTHLGSAAKDCLKMAESYYSDACHFYEKGKWLDAFACINYAHGWLDCGARLGLFDVGHDSKLFAVD